MGNTVHEKNGFGRLRGSLFLVKKSHSDYYNEFTGKIQPLLFCKALDFLQAKMKKWQFTSAHPGKVCVFLQNHRKEPGNGQTAGG